MDTPTQALLGATIGQALFGRRLGRKAAWWGAVAGVLPDLDVIPIAFMGPWGDFLFHRGPSHALWVGPVAGPILGYIAWRWYKRKSVERNEPNDTDHREARTPAADPGSRDALRAWMGLFVLGLLTHPLLDLFTSYGTQLLSPFSNHRFAIQGVAIVDPVYSLVLALALVVGSRYRARPRIGAWAAGLALLLSTAYLFYGLHLNTRAEQEVNRQLAAEGVTDAQVYAYPTIFQVYLRRIVVRAPSEVRVGMLSMWNPHPMDWQTFTPPENPLIDSLRETEAGRIFQWFAMDQIVPRVIQEDGGITVVELHDLRYGFRGPPDRGMWGIRARFDRNGHMIGEVKRFDNMPPGGIREAFAQMFRDTFGRGRGSLTQAS